MKKFCLVSIVLPPTGSGQGIVLYNLLKDINPSCMCLVSSMRYFGKGNYYQGKVTRKIDCPYYYIPVFPDSFVEKILKPGFITGMLLKLYLAFRILMMMLIIRIERCSTVVGCSADLFDPWCSFRAAKYTKTKYIFYAFDDYLKQWNRYPQYVQFAEKAGREIFNEADAVIVPNEYLQQQFFSEYHVDSVIVRNSIEIARTGDGDRVTDNPLHDPVVITYTGDIYTAQSQAIVNVIQAILQISEYHIELHIYCGRSGSELEKQGISGPIILHEPVHYSEMKSVYQSSDILLLPLSFHSPYMSIINTSAPGKMADYMDARKPILVHAPADSFISWYFTTHDCGFVVSEDDVSLVRKALVDLIENQALRERLSKSARERVVLDFSSDVSRNTFLSLIE